MKLAVVGSRSFSDFSRLCSVLDRLCEKTDIIVSGGAEGADKFAERYAQLHGITTEIYPADWAKYGNAAGMIRNKQIIAAADYIVAFWDGKSKGTKNSIALAEAKGIKVQIEHFNAKPD